MPSPMKIRTAISDELLIRARKHAAQNHLILKQVIDQASGVCSNRRRISPLETDALFGG